MFIYFLFLILLSCSLEEQGDNPLLTLSFPSPQEGSRSYIPPQNRLTPTRYNLTIRSGEEVLEEVTLDQPFYEKNIPPGNLEISVTAFNDQNQPLYWGEDSLYFHENTQRVLTLSPPNGPGWIELQATYPHQLGDTLRLSLENQEVSLSWEFPLGASDLLQETLEVPQGLYQVHWNFGFPQAPYKEQAEALLVFPGLTTNLTLDFLPSSVAPFELSVENQEYQLLETSFPGLWSPYCAENLPPLSPPEGVYQKWFLDGKPQASGEEPPLPTEAGQYALKLFEQETPFKANLYQADIQVVSNEEEPDLWFRFFPSSQEIPLQGVREILNLGNDTFLSANYDNNSLSFFRLAQQELIPLEVIRILKNITLDRPFSLCQRGETVFVLDKGGHLMEGRLSGITWDWKHLVTLEDTPLAMATGGEKLLISSETSLYVYDIVQQALSRYSEPMGAEDLILLTEGTWVAALKDQDQIAFFQMGPEGPEITLRWPEAPDTALLNGPHFLSFHLASETLFLSSYYNDLLRSFQYDGTKWAPGATLTTPSMDIRYPRGMYFQGNRLNWLISGSDEMITANWSGTGFTQIQETHLGAQGIWDAPRAHSYCSQGYLIAGSQPDGLHLFRFR